MKKKIRNLSFVIFALLLMTTTLKAYGKNIDFSIKPVAENIDSGLVANFIIDIKTTGSNKKLENIKLKLDLPDEKYQLTTDLKDLSLLGVEPIKKNNSLEYSYDQLPMGLSEKIIIEFKTQNGTTLNEEEIKLKASFFEEEKEYNYQASSKINASGSLSLAKRIKDIDGKGEFAKVKTDSEIIYSLRASSNKKDYAQLYIKEGSKIKIVDKLPENLAYISDDRAGQYDRDSHTVTWYFDAPNYKIQEENKEYLFLEDIEIKTKLINFKEEDNFKSIKNILEGEIKLIDNSQVKRETSASFTLAIGGTPIDEPVGSYYRGGFRGPLDGKGNIASASEPNPEPQVYDSAYLGFRHNFLIHPGTGTEIKIYDDKKEDFVDFNKKFRIENILEKGYEHIRFEYDLDSKLILDNFRVRRPSLYYSSKIDSRPFDITDLPIMEISFISTSGIEKKEQIDFRKENSEYIHLDPAKIFSDKNIQIDKIKILITPNENNQAIDGRIGATSFFQSYFNVVEGSVGKATNKIETYIKKKGSSQEIKYIAENVESTYGDRSVNIIPKPQGTLPIAETEISLRNNYGGLVLPGDNILDIKFRNTDGSLDNISPKYEIFVKSPVGIDLNLDEIKLSAPNTLESANFLETIDGNHYYKLVVDGSDKGLRPSESLDIEIPVVINKSVPGNINLDIYARSTSKNLLTPEYPSDIPTNTIQVTDRDELVVNNLAEGRTGIIKSENNYSTVKNQKVTTKKTVKGFLDKDFSNFAHTQPGGRVDFKLSLEHTLNSAVDKMVIIDTLPRIGDIGITDNNDRGSVFDLYLTEAVELSESQKDLFNIYYSVENNPSRNELNKVASNSLEDPETAKDPGWKTYEEIENKEEIKSIKIELKEGKVWNSSEKLEFTIPMKAPETIDENHISLSKEDTDKKFNAAWNSFALAIPNLQIVEPERVGVAFVGELELVEPKIDKFVDGDKKQVEFHPNTPLSYTIDIELPDLIRAYDNLVIEDKIDDSFEIKQVKFNGEILDKSHYKDNHLILELNKNDLSKLNKESIKNLKLEIDVNLKNLKLDDNLKPISIENTAQVTVNGKTTVEPDTPTQALPKLNYGQLVVSVSEGSNKIEELETIDDYKKDKLLSSLVEVESAKDNLVQIKYTSQIGEENKIKDLPVGKYIVRQIKSVDGYQITSESLLVEVKENNLTVVEILNPREAKIEIIKSVEDTNKDGFAEAGEELFYKISVKNTGGLSAKDVIIQDSLTNLEDYVELPEYANVTKSNKEEKITLDELVIGYITDIQENETIEITFPVIVKEGLANDQLIINSAKANDEISHAEIKYKKPLLEISKFVVDGDENGKADPGEELSYSIHIKNFGQLAAKNILVKDNLTNLLPNIVDPSENPVYLVTNGERNLIGNISQLINEGINIDKLGAGESISIEFKVTMLDELDESLDELINTASVNHLESTVTIKVNKPNIPDVDVPIGPDKPTTEDPGNPIKPEEPEFPTRPEPENPVDPKPEKPVDPEPEKPVDPKPEKPVDLKPEKPVDPKPGKPVDPKPEKPNGGVNSGNNTAPQTGDAGLAFTASTMLLSGVALLVSKEKRK